MISGLQKTTLIDYPGEIAATLFTSGCNFRCSFCHNPDLVNKNNKSRLDIKEVLDFLSSRKDKLTGVCITGGEPLVLGRNLFDLIKDIKQIGLKVKLDTNGSSPGLLKELINNKMIDYVAMDIKAPPTLYSHACGTGVDINKIKQSVDLLLKGDIEYEFRTTVVPMYLPLDKVDELGKFIKGCRKYFIQQFNNSHDLLNESFRHIPPYPKETLIEISNQVKGYVESVEIRY